jgi:hypothetical protein
MLFRKKQIHIATKKTILAKNLTDTYYRLTTLSSFAVLPA